MSGIDNHVIAEGCSLSPRADRLARFRQIDPHGESLSIVSLGLAAVVAKLLIELREKYE